MLFQRGNIWWFRFRFLGRTIRESTKQTNRNRAAEAERQYRNRLLDSYNAVPERKAPLPFSVASENLLTAKVNAGKLRPSSQVIERLNLKHLLPVFGADLLTDITADAINDYITGRKREGAANKTIMLEIGTLRGVLRKHRLWEQVLPDLNLLKVKNDVGRCLSHDEQSCLLEACLQSRSRSLYPAVALGLNTGLRRDELRLLRWSQINLVKKQVRVGESKTAAGEGRSVPLNNDVFAILTHWVMNFPHRRQSDYVFPTEKYGEAGSYALNVTKPIGSWKEAWEAAKKRADIVCRFHDLRHTAASRMLEAGVPFSTVASIMGWSPSTMILMSKRYGHISEAALREAVTHLDRGVEGAQNRAQFGAKIQ